MISIEVSGKFEKRYKRLSATVKEAAKYRENIFRENPFHPSLETHKLHGKDAGAWAFSINRKFRIKFTFLGSARPASGGARVLFLDVGTHDIYE